jgi:hypothetical protein
MKADKYALYLKSVQTPKEDARFLVRRFPKIAGRPLRLLREDFCGTANLICEFVKLHRENRGIGIDSDRKPLNWCERNNFQELDADQKSRVTLCHADVLRVRSKPVDMIVALNYSYSVFHTRSGLTSYFKSVWQSLSSNGVFMLDVHGGSSVPVEDQQLWKLKEFQYIWEVTNFDPITHQIICKIHFILPDGRTLKNAFVYHWRLWTLPELREILEEIGFRDVHVLWEGTNPRTNMGNGILRRVQKGHSEGAWYAMIVGRK